MNVNERQRGSQLEEKLFSIFSILKSKVFSIRKTIDSISIHDHGVQITLENGIVTFQTKEIYVSSDNRYRDNPQEEFDFHSDLIQLFFVQLKHLMLYNDKITVNSTGFIRYSESKIKLSSIS